MSEYDPCSRCRHRRQYHWVGMYECDRFGCGCSKFVEPLDESPNEKENVAPQPTYEDSGEPKSAKEDR